MENTVGPWRTRSLAQGELLGGDFSPFSFKASLMGHAKAGEGLAQLVPVRGTWGRVFLQLKISVTDIFWGNTGTSLSPSPQNGARPVRNTGPLVPLVLQNGGRVSLARVGAGKGDIRDLGHPCWVSHPCDDRDTSQWCCHLPGDLQHHPGPAPCLAQHPKSGPSWHPRHPAVTS